MSISERKTSHLDLCAEDDVEARGKTSLLEDVEFFHDSLPELCVDEIDLSMKLFGRQMKAPLLITGMTGGAARAGEINQILAAVAETLGIAFGVGSQRAMLNNPELLATYQIRHIAPSIPIFGNIGAVQAAQLSIQQAQDLIGLIDADALCIHLNPGQEIIQPEGDRDFRGCLDGITRLVQELSTPIIVKETGSGLSPRTLDRLKTAGVQWVDTSGAGGTTWIGVETLRATPEKQGVGELFWDWGVPTAASIVYAKRREFNVIGSGGLRTGMDAARAIALGASLAGMALPWLRAAHEGGTADALRFGQTTIDSLLTACLLTGSANIAELQQAPKLLGSRLQQWLATP